MGEFGNKKSFLNDDFGVTLKLPVKKIQGNFKIHDALLNNLVSMLKTEDSGKNFWPIIVEKDSKNKDFYNVVLNGQILEAARKAGLDFVWCIIIDQSMLNQIKVESGELRISVKSATQETLTEAFDYINQTIPNVKIDAEKAAQLIIEKRDLGRLNNLDFLTDSNCGIGPATLSKIESYLLIEKVEISVYLDWATEEEIVEALDFIKNNYKTEKGGSLKSIESKIAAKIIIQKRNESEIKDLKFLKKSNCKIGDAILPIIEKFFILPGNNDKQKN